MPTEEKKERKESIGLRVDKSAIDNCTAIAEALKWSFNSTVEYAMKRVRLEDIMQIMNDIQAVKKILPSHYDVQESEDFGNIYCRSTVGIPEFVDKSNPNGWPEIIKKIRNYFEGRYIKWEGNDSFKLDFIIYIK